MSPTTNKLGVEPSNLGKVAELTGAYTDSSDMLRLGFILYLVLTFVESCAT